MIHGFIKTNEQVVGELDATMISYRHERTGLEVIWLSRDEENKTFGIAFETLPENDTGVFHILEHSVLCGSDRYPLKEPFVALMKSSMNTFLNAMTYPDKTLYPISSRNGKDFMNLISVYLDAVFAPLIYRKPEIFRQEGWHCAFDEDGSACFNGVVYNEMKGVYSDPDEICDYAINRALFPDTPYRFDYGGDPVHIPELTYEAFLDAHRRFYSPSNACVFLDGRLDINAVLKLLDEDYLRVLPVGARIAPPPLQAPVNAGLVRAEYEVATPEEEEGQARLILSNVICDCSEREKIIATDILCDLLCESNHSPLSRVLLQSGLVEDVNMSVQDDLMQPYVKLEMKNLKKEDADRVEALVHDTLTRIAQDGIDAAMLDAAIANTEFKMKERNYGSYPQGIILCMQVLGSRLHGLDPAAELEVNALFESLRKKAREGCFEALIRDVLLGNPHGCKLLLLPSHTLGEVRSEAEAQRVTGRLSVLSEAEVKALKNEEAQLIAWQQSEDSAEMPALTLGDIDAEPDIDPSEVRDINGLRVLLHPIAHNGICYCRIYFDVNGLTEAQLSDLSLLCYLLGKLDTGKYSAAELVNLTRSTFGSFGYFVTGYAADGDAKDNNVKLVAFFSTLSENVDAALELLIHILRETKLDDTAAIHEIIRQHRLDLYNLVLMRGSMAAASRIRAAYSVDGVVDECCGGINYYKYLKSLDRAEDFTHLRSLADRLLSRKNLVMSFTGDIPELSLKALDAFPEMRLQAFDAVLVPWGAVHEGIVIPSDVAFAARGGNILANGGSYDSRMALAAHIISLDYLWNRVRVQGGAYGVQLGVSDVGICSCTSFRDPSAARSLDVYAHCGEYLDEAMQRETDLTGAIIGTVSDASPQLSYSLRGRREDARYLKHVSADMLRRRRRELLGTKPADLQRIAAMLTSALNEGESVCVIGAREQIEACEGLKDMFVL